MSNTALGAPRIIVSTKRLAVPRGALVIDLTSQAFGQVNEWWPASRTTFRLATFSAVSAPGYFAFDDLIDFIWGADEDGGPIDPRRNIHQRVHQQKPLLAWLGLRIIFKYWRIEVAWERAEARAA